MAKTGKSRLPKKVAGVRLPKTFRKTAEDMLSAPLVKEILAAVLVSAGAYLLSKNRSKAKRLMGDFAEAGSQAGSVGAVTIGQAFDTLAGYLAKAHADEDRKPKSARQRAKIRRENKDARPKAGKKPSARTAQRSRDAQADSMTAVH